MQTAWTSMALFFYAWATKTGESESLSYFCRSVWCVCVLENHPRDVYHIIITENQRTCYVTVRIDDLTGRHPLRASGQPTNYYYYSVTLMNAFLHCLIGRAFVFRPHESAVISICCGSHFFYFMKPNNLHVNLLHSWDTDPSSFQYHQSSSEYELDEEFSPFLITEMEKLNSGDDDSLQVSTHTQSFFLWYEFLSPLTIRVPFHFTLLKCYKYDGLCCPFGLYVCLCLYIILLMHSHLPSHYSLSSLSHLKLRR